MNISPTSIVHLYLEHINRFTTILITYVFVITNPIQPTTNRLHWQLPSAPYPKTPSWCPIVQPTPSNTKRPLTCARSHSSPPSMKSRASSKPISLIPFAAFLTPGYPPLSARCTEESTLRVLLEADRLLAVMEAMIHSRRLEYQW